MVCILFGGKQQSSFKRRRSASEPVSSFCCHPGAGDSVSAHSQGFLVGWLWSWRRSEEVELATKYRQGIKLSLKIHIYMWECLLYTNLGLGVNRVKELFFFFFCFFFSPHQLLEGMHSLQVESFHSSGVLSECVWNVWETLSYTNTSY